MKSLIVIPARYGSSRFPGKPLTKIAGKTLLEHVCLAAQNAAQQIPDVEVLVATDDKRILQHAQDLNVHAVLTPETCATGTDRVIAAIQQLTTAPKHVINLQGDAPLTPVQVIVKLLHALNSNPIVTPVMQLSWEYLDVLRQAKRNNPFSGTTAVIDPNDMALWFSKQIIPALRNEDQLRSQSKMSPIFQHLGIYGYTLEMLDKFAKHAPSKYEQLEGLEQLRFLENGYKIKAVPIILENLNAWRGVDTPDDAQFVEQLFLTGNAKQ